ncbi:hypothetical protein F5Y07DRAFT_130300 [Xylaria sp. FL0933]|nr:hypothetical protein F5Y07DRAFT_130300 [Xylaria sp. FL0933]
MILLIALGSALHLHGSLPFVPALQRNLETPVNCLVCATGTSAIPMGQTEACMIEIIERCGVPASPQRSDCMPGAQHGQPTSRIFEDIQKVPRIKAPNTELLAWSIQRRSTDWGTEYSASSRLRSPKQHAHTRLPGLHTANPLHTWKATNCDYLHCIITYRACSIVSYCTVQQKTHHSTLHTCSPPCLAPLPISFAA